MKLCPHEASLHSPLTVHAAYGIAMVDSLKMSASRTLERLYSLDTSSPNFSRYLYCLIKTDEEEQYLSSLQGLELTRFVDFLDGVRSLLLASFQHTKR